MAKYVKLGKQASSFFDPVTRLSLVPGQVCKVPLGANTSQVYTTAIKNLHIVPAAEEEFEEYEESVADKKEEEAKTSKKKKKELAAKPEEDEDDEEDDEEDEEDEDEDEDPAATEDDEEDEDDVDTMTKAELVEALKSSGLPDDVKSKLSKMQKPELQELFKQQIKK